MTILEQLNAINATFQRLHQDFLRFDREIQALSSRFAGEAADEQRKWDAERTLTAGKREDVLKFYRIAKDNSHKELVTGLPGQRPDLARLNQMIQRIDVNDRSDPTAGQIIDLCSQYVSWLDRELAQIDQKGQSGQLAVDRRKEQEAARLTQQKKQVLVSCERYLQGPEVANLVRLFEDIHRDYEITPAYFRTWGAQTKRRRMMLFGFQQFPMDVPQKLCAALAASLGHHFDEKTKLVNCPCGFTTDSPEEIHVEYVDRNEDRAKKGIQALILNFLRYFPLSEYRVTVLDHIHYNADVLGPLAALSAGKHSPIEACPQDAKALRQSISILANYYRKVESKIGSQTLHQYNRQQKPEHRIPCRILILNRTQDLFRGSEEPELAYVINNAKKFGIILIQMTKSSDGGSKGKDREQKLLASSKDCIRIISAA